MISIYRFPIRFRLLCGLGAFLAGVGIGSAVNWTGSLVITVAGGVLLGGFILLRSYPLAVAVLSVAMVLLGFSWSTWHRQQLVLPAPIHYGGRAMVSSVRFRKPPQERIMLKLLDSPHAGRLVQAYGYDWRDEPGSTIAITATITPSKYRSDLGRNVIGSSGDVAVTAKISDPGALARFRHQLQQRVGESLPEPYASLAIGLLTGASDDFDASFREDLQRTGTTHLVAVSGFNLTIVALFLYRLGLSKGRALGLGLALASVVAYVILAGASASILRGAVVATLSLTAVALGRVTHRLPILVIAAFILSLITPLGMLYNLSWQLSFLAFAGILFVGPYLGQWFANRLGNWGSTLGETLSAEMLTLPLILYQFNTLSLVAPLVNGLVLGIIPLAMALSALLSVASLIWLPLGQLVAWAVYPVLFAVIKPIQWASDLPYASITVTTYPFVWFVVTYGVIAILFFILTRRSKA